MRSANLHDEEKSATIKEAELHLERATKERSLYVTITKQVAIDLQAGSVLGPHPVCSYNGTMHYSFDFAQQVHYPSNPLQPGTRYFLRHQRNVHCLVSAVRHFQSKLSFSWTSVCKLARVPIVSFHCFISSLKTMGLEKLTCTCMQTTAQGKIRILP